MKVFLVLFVAMTALAENPSPVKYLGKNDSSEREVQAKEEAQKEGPKSWDAAQQELKSQIENLFEASKKVNQPKEKEQARKTIDTAVDWDQISRTCLGKDNWAKNPKGREQFKKLLQEIIALSAYSRMEDFWKGAKYEFTKIKITGDKADVVAEFTTKDDDTYDLEYFMTKKGKKWYMYDLSYEDLKYSVNINEQITAFLKDKSFDQLIARMNKKKAELLEDEKNPKKDKKKSESL